MTQTLDMKNAEKQVFRLATFEDGIWEIYLGLFFTMMGFFPITRELLGPALNAVLISGSYISFGSCSVDRQETYHLITHRIGEVRP